MTVKNNSVNKTVLLVEDNENILTANREFLLMNGYGVLCAATLAAAESLLESSLPDIVILDVMMPDGSGFDFCVKLREEYDIPVLFLTALGDKSDLVKGLRLGGDDYLVKPYDVYELLARVEALLRRVRIDRTSAEAKNKGFTIGPLYLDYIRQRAYIGKADLLLKTKEFNLLRVLAERRGEYISAEKLYDAVWGKIEPSDHRTLWVAMSGIRKCLAEENTGGEIVVEHKRNIGYRLIYNAKYGEP